MKAVMLAIMAFLAVLGVSSPFAWLTHVIYCIADKEWGFLIAGAIAFPIGIIHGFGIWFGVW